tara:strand:+ start:212 stop:442 length:231 start_codon:yes stop_codon:yes gene_type:complete
MDELMDMMVTDDSPSQISDKLKDMLYAKSATKVDDIKSTIATSMFGDTEVEVDDEDEVETEAELEVDSEEPQEEDS